MLSHITAAVAAVLVTATPVHADELVEVEAFNDVTLVEGPLLSKD